MKTDKLHKQKLMLIVLISITVIFYILGHYVFANKHYSFALLGISASSLGLLLIQLIRIFKFTKNPESYDDEQIHLKDERTRMLVGKSKSSAYDIETFIIFGITAYGIYLDDVGFVAAILVLWVIRGFSFKYYFYKNNKEY